MAFEGVDPSIALQAGRNTPAFGPDWNAVNNNQRTAIALQNAQQVQQAQNALKALYSNPQSYDPKTMQPTPEAMRQLMRVSPSAGMDLQNNLVSLQEKRAQSQFRQGAIAKEYTDQGRQIAAESIAAYDEFLKTMPPEAAMRRVQDEIYTPAVTTLKQGMPPELAQRVSPTFDPIRARSTIATAKTVEDQAKEARDFKEETDYGRQPYVRYRTYGDGRTTDITGKSPYTPTGVAEPKSAEEKILHAETTDGKQIDIMRSPIGGWLDALTKDPIDPKTIKPGTLRPQSTAQQATPEQARATAEAIYDYRQPPLSSYAMKSGTGPQIMEALKEIGDERGKPYDARKYGQAKVLMEGYSRTTPNSPGGNMLSINTAVQHLAQLETLSDALKNKDTRAINYVINYAQTQLGHPEVTNFNTAAQIVADETLKAVIGSGAVFDREKLGKQLSDVASPEQIKGGVDTIKSLMGGRANSLLKQWTSAGLPEDDFESKLTPEARDALGKYLPKPKEGNTATAPQKETAPAAPQKEGAGPPASMFKPGVRSITNDATGETWVLKDGKVVKQ